MQIEGPESLKKDSQLNPTNISPQASAATHAPQRSRNQRVSQKEQKDKLVHDIYGVVGGALGCAGGTEANLSHANSGSNELREFLTDSHQTQKNSKNSNSLSQKSSLHLKRSNSSSGMVPSYNAAQTFESYGNLQDQSLDFRQEKQTEFAQ
jgi:hypothetical protein